jgi:creatinine amidohydrolase
MDLISVLLEENTRRVIRRAVAAGTLRAAVVPLSATEQHNEHLAMNHDTRSVMLVACEAARRLFPSVVVTPPVHFGVSEHWMDHPGTLTLSPGTFTQVVYEVCDSLRRHGIRRILILNGHGGNRRPMEARLDEFRARLGVRLDFCPYWEAYSPATVADVLESGECPGHAGEFETSVALAAFPESVHPVEERYPEEELRISLPQRASDDRRFFTTARQATPAKGQVMLEIAVEWLAARLRRLIEEAEGR